MKTNSLSKTLSKGIRFVFVLGIIYIFVVGSEVSISIGYNLSKAQETSNTHWDSIVKNTLMVGKWVIGLF